MKKLGLIAAFLILCFVALIVGSYVHALSPKNKAADLAFETAKAKAGIQTMDEFYLYHGKESVSVVIGKTNDGEKKIVWIPDNRRENIQIQKLNNGKSREEILSIVKQNSHPQKIISIKPGIENNVTLWEVTYLDNLGKYNYDYYDFRTGEWLKYYRSI